MNDYEESGDEQYKVQFYCSGNKEWFTYENADDFSLALEILRDIPPGITGRYRILCVNTVVFEDVRSTLFPTNWAKEGF